jgi:hypothetical protein
MKRNPNSSASKAFKKVRAESISTLKKKAWKVFSKWVRERDQYVCYTCGKDMKGSPALHAGHFISRRMNSTLFDEMNVHAQCMFCNMYDYGATGPYAERLIADYGLEAFQALIARSKVSKQFTRPELEAIITKYSQP